MNKKSSCPLNYTMNLIGTKWKPLILFHLLAGGLRSGILQKKIEGISNKMFTQTVRELEKDGLLTRKVFPVVPPKVEYKLSKRGASLENILRSLDAMGFRGHLAQIKKFDIKRLNKRYELQCS